MKQEDSVGISKVCAKKAVQEAFDIANEKIGNNMEAVMKGVADSMTQINKAVNETLKDD